MINLIVAIGAVTFLLFYFAFNINEKEQYFLKMLLIMFGMGLLVLMSSIPNGGNCEAKINQSIVVGNTTTNTYTQVCVKEISGDGAKIFYKRILWVNRIFWIYVLGYLTYWGYQRYLMRKVED